MILSRRSEWCGIRSRSWPSSISHGPSGSDPITTSKKYLVPQLQKAFGACALHSITTRLVEDYQTTLLTAGKTPATANRYLATLKHMFTKAGNGRWSTRRPSSG